MIGYGKTAYHAAKVAGICTVPGCQRLAPERVTCLYHRARHSARQCIYNARDDIRSARIARERDIRADKRRRGECLKCSRPHIAGSPRCERCRARQAAYDAKRDRSELTPERLILKRGKCIQCEAPRRFGKTKCKACASRDARAYLLRTGQV